MKRMTPRERAIWNAKHRDYRGVTEGVRTVLHYNRETGGTELWPLSDVAALSNEELGSLARWAGLEK